MFKDFRKWLSKKASILLIPTLLCGLNLNKDVLAKNQSSNDNRVLKTSFGEKWNASLGVEGEFALALLNGARKGGGNEASFGDFYVNLKGNLENKLSEDSSFGIDVDLVPRDSVLDFNVEENPHNHNRLRADNYLGRPDTLANLHFRGGDEQQSFGVKFGGMKFAGLEQLEGSPTKYYASMLSPILLSQYYDKGILLEYAREPFALSFGVTDGDWETGEPSVFRYHDSRANSTPGCSSTLEFNLGKLKVYGSWVGDNIGSSKGQKKYKNDLSGAVSYTIENFLGKELEVRGFVGEFERGERLNNPSPESTNFRGLEAAIRDIYVGDKLIDIYAGYSEMELDSIYKGSNIWVDGSSYENQWQAGIRLKEPFGWKNASLNFSGSFRNIDNPERWRIQEGRENVYLVSLSAAF